MRCELWIAADFMGYSPEVDHDDSADQADAYAPRPGRRITANMLAGYNLAYFRKAAGLTQEELGEQIGWSNVAVSAAERSWSGQRVRKFDADDLVILASALDIPIAAFFLPPVDDTSKDPYVLGDGGNAIPMSDLLSLALSDPTEDGDSAMEAYEGRLVEAVSCYLPSGVAEALATRLNERALDAQIVKALREARKGRRALESFWNSLHGLAADNDLLQDMLLSMLESTPEGKALLEEERRQWQLDVDETDGLTAEERHRAAWDNLRPQFRARQALLAAISTELFGEPRPLIRSEIDRVVAEGRRRGVTGYEAAVLLNQDGTYELVRPYNPDPQEGDP